jgi:hypothetical protein
MARRKLKEFRLERIEFEKYHRSTRNQLYPYFRNALYASIAPVIRHVQEFGLEGTDPALLIRRDIWKPLYTKIYPLFGVRAAKREYYRQKKREAAAQKAIPSSIDFLVNTWTNILRDYALTYTYRIQRQLNETTIEMITRALGEDYGLEIGEGGKIQLFIKKIEAESRKRAQKFARTEATTISNLGKDLGARSWLKDQPGQAYKVWLGRITGERETHLEENDTIIPIEQMHVVGGERCERPGDIHLSAKERINCRCTESYMSQAVYEQYVRRGRIVDGKLIGAS